MSSSQPMRTEPPPGPQRGWRSLGLPLLILATGVGASVLAAYYFASSAAQRDRQAFDRHVQRQIDSLARRVDTYIALLRGAAGLIASSGSDITSQQFKRYVDPLMLRTQYPGILGLGYSRRVDAEARDELTQAMRNQGVAGFHIWPEGPRSEYHTIVHLEPLDRRNQAAIGYDMFTDPTRRAAMERARDSGLPAASGKITLVQEIDEHKQPGFLIYLPVYEGGVAPDTVDSRRQQLEGFAYSPFRASDFFASMAREDRNAEIDFEVYDGDAIDADSLLYRSTAPGSPRQGKPRLTSVRRITIAGRPWTIALAAKAGFNSSVSVSTIALIAGGGVLVSTLLAALAWLEENSRRKTERDRAKLLDANAALQQSEERFRLMANSIPQLAWMARPDGWIFWYNQRWYDYTGATPEQMEGWGWQAVHDPAELPRIVETWKAALAAGDKWEDVFPLRRHDGQMRWHLSRAQPLKDAAGNALLWFGTNTDVTEQRRAAEERERLLQAEQRARADAEQANRLKDEFLATLSHELRTPLNAILGWAQLLSVTPHDNAEIAEGINVIERNARAQARLIEDLLDMSRIVSGKLRLDIQRLDVAEIVQAAVQSVAPAAEAKEIRLETAIDRHAGPVRGDAARLQQVVWNLLSNAIKFTPKGGKVQLALERINSHVEITVADTGVGIEPDFLPHVFEQFRQADGTTTRRHVGLGLGLAIVKNLVEAHGGSVRAASPGAGKGATFTVALPLMVVHEELPSGGEHPCISSDHVDHALAGGGRMLAGVSVLVVDDESDARSLIRRTLEACEATVFVAASAAEAVETLRRERPRVLVSDIGMPEEDGYSLVHRIRKLPPDEGGATPAAALTAFARSEDRRRALLAGFQAHVAKPVEPAELVAVVASLAGVTDRAGANRRA
ncbi:MAG: hypothetical protein DCC67_05230 [Planctomycetota bacterium]|nr:MAG: hypothetical protein DCC67_05230 [Planctomycetota bacterium]